MGAVRVGAEFCRRIERDTDLVVEFAAGFGSHDFEFVTPDHRHGRYNKATKAWSWIPDDEVVHYANGCAPFNGGVDASGAYRFSSLQEVSSEQTG